MKLAIIIVSVVMLYLLSSCCPLATVQQERHSENVLIEVRSDSVTGSRIVPDVIVTDESATFIAKPTIETIDTVINARGTLRAYNVKIVRTSEPKKLIAGDSISTNLRAEYWFEVRPVKADSLFNQITTTDTKKVIYKNRAWYELPAWIIGIVLSFLIGILIGRKLL